MKIKITTEQRPWANGKAHPNGAEIETDDKTGAALVKSGFAVENKPKKKTHYNE